MTPRQVRSVLMVAQHGSVNRAAKVLHLAPSSVSAQLKELSSELEVELFVAKGRNIVLSEMGRALLPSLQAFVNQEQMIKQQAQQASQSLSGSMTLFAPSSMCIYRLPAIIECLQAVAPQLELLLTHEPFDYATALLKGDIDAAITVSADPAIDQNKNKRVSHIDTSRWSQYTLHKEEVIYVTHPTLYQDRALSVNDLETHSIIATEPECSYRLRADAHFADAGSHFIPKQSFSNVEVIKRCLLAKMGLGLLPRCVVEQELYDGHLMEQPVIGAPYQFFSQLIVPKGVKPSAKVMALVKVVQSLSHAA